MRRYCKNYRCLFRKTCFLAVPPIEGEKVREFVSESDDIYCEKYDTMLSKHDLTDHIQQYLDRKYKKYGIGKKRMV